MPNVYQLNDLINFTCSSGASKPAARLAWLLNDLPLSALSLPGQPDPFELTHSQLVSSRSSRLTETRSNLALRLPAQHLRQLASKLTRGRHKPAPALAPATGTGTGAYLPLKLSCVSQMFVEFTSESSILISGGKTSTSKRSGNHHRTGGGNGEPLASLWQRDPDEDRGDLVTHNPRRRPGFVSGSSSSDSDEGADESQSDASGPGPPRISPYRWPSSLAMHSTRLAQHHQHHSSGWNLPSSVAPPGGTNANHNPASEQPRTRQPQAAARHHRLNVVWTSGQLRDQSRHIDQLLRRSGANQLEAPRIEARPVNSDEGDGGDPETRDDALSEGETTFENGELLPPAPITASSSSSNNNYGLNELVNFTCYHQRGEPLAATPGDPDRPSVQLRWFLNELEVNADFINFFDGGKFYASPGPVPGGYPKNSSARWSSGPQSASERPTQRARTGARSLLIEFTASLFQLKELNLKCKTIVEQQLNEFEESQILHLATSPFIQAQPHVAPKLADQQHYGQSNRPSLYQTNHRQRDPNVGGGGGGGQQQVNPRQRGNVIRVRPSGRSSASSSSQGHHHHRRHYHHLFTLVLSSCLVSCFRLLMVDFCVAGRLGIRL